MEGIFGQDQAGGILERYSPDQAGGRTILLTGGRGTGKFTVALKWAQTQLGMNPFLSTDFMFYRNDDFSLKTRFFIENRNQAKCRILFENYLYYLLGRISVSITCGEISKSGLKLKKMKKGSESYGIQDFRSDMEEILVNRILADFLENPSFLENLILTSDEISRKQRIPIDFIRKLIEFHSLKSSAKYRISVIGGFENATEEAQNSSLKLLEEPPQNSAIILTAESPERILPTILSRSVIIKTSRLSAVTLQEIFGFKPDNRFCGTVEMMEDQVYHYSAKSRERVHYFFDRIAPKVQHGNELFGFVDEIISGENNQLVSKFLEELLEFIRGLHLSRQQHLRNSEYNDFYNKEYEDIYSHLASNTFTAELKDISDEISGCLSGIRYGNMTESVMLPALLINISRWYQKRKN